MSNNNPTTQSQPPGDEAADSNKPTSSSSDHNHTSTSTAPNFILLSEACSSSLQSLLEHYQKHDWHDFSTAGRSHVALTLAKEHIFKSSLETFKKDNPHTSKEPIYKTIPDYFGYGVKVEMKLEEECPTNVGKPYIITTVHECYFNGEGRLESVNKRILN
ncbi:hypothetical protein C9374_010980 [Naegleria lovaniensis]|uniref:Uncharacterized protein n=1 Tax=Naegleria lovaniensis TaxID=51637 RepID=A0AA88GFW8_NAELO|nr:uncharacterized protein C9374_010980 [Naegleria lovaniensis]KAG2374143.1 hypothetical protein C9374_010980 [Naegleria lovaniensis]